MLKLSPSALKAFLACPRSWYLSHVKRVPRDVPKYVLGGQDLDEAAEHYLMPPERLPKGRQLALRMVSETTERELECIKPHLPHPGTVHTQHTLRMPCPGVEGVELYGKLDYMTPASDFMVIGDIKRVWAEEAVMTVEQLTADVQLNMYAYMLWAQYEPQGVTGVWTYCVRGTKPKARPVYAPLDRERVNDFMHEVTFPAARAMLDLMQREQLDVAHNPDSCNGGGDRCFVAKHCLLYKGQIATGVDIMSKYKVRKIDVNPPVEPSTTVDTSPVVETTGEFAPETVRDVVTGALDEGGRPTIITSPLADFPLERAVSLAAASTEQILAELKDRGYYGVELRA